MRNIKALMGICVMLLSAGAVCAGEKEQSPTFADWPCWRGATCSGSAGGDADRLIAAPDQAKLAWRNDTTTFMTYAGHPTASGCASPVIADGKVYLYYYAPSRKQTEKATKMRERDYRDFKELYERDKEFIDEPYEKWVTWATGIVVADYVLCVDLDTGKTLWNRELELCGDHVFRARTALTCAVDNGLVFVYGRSGHMYALDAETGKTEWKWKDKDVAANVAKGIEKARKAGKPTNGIGGGANGKLQWHVMTAGDVVVCKTGHRARGGMTAFRQDTGEVLWQHHRSPDSYLRWRPGRRDLIISGGACIDPNTGKALWNVREKFDISVRTGRRADGSAAVSGKYIVYPDGSVDGNQCGLICVAGDENGVELQWTLPDGYDSACASMAIHNGYVYFLARPKGYLRIHCVNLKTGKIEAEQVIGGTSGGGRIDGKGGTRKCPYGGGDAMSSLVCVGDWMMYRTADKNWSGRLAVWKADPKDFSFVGHLKPVSFATGATAAVADGRLVVRGKSRLVCHDLRKKNDQ
jgi:outer membrane protein assembly factor BamB